MRLGAEPLAWHTLVQDKKDSRIGVNIHGP